MKTTGTAGATIHATCEDCGERFETYHFGGVVPRTCKGCQETEKRRAEEEGARVLGQWQADRLIAVERFDRDEIDEKLGVPTVFRGAKIEDFPPALKGPAAHVMSRGGLFTMTGPAGRGKTRAAWAIAVSAVRGYAAYPSDDMATRSIELGVPPDSIQWITSAKRCFQFERVPDLVIHIQGLIGGEPGAVDSCVENLRTFDGILILDDLGAEKVSDFVIQNLYSVISAREEWARPTIVTTNLTVDEVGERFSDRIASRLAGGKILRMHGDDRRLPTPSPDRPR